MSAARTSLDERAVLFERLKRLPPERRAALLARLQGGTAAAETAPDSPAIPEAIPRIPRVERGGPLPLSYAQERLWFLEQLAPGRPVYNIALAIRLRGRLDRAALDGALDGVVRRHEVLRARLRDLGGRPVQEAAPAEAIRLVPPLVDLRAADAIGAGEAQRLAEEEAARPFDLGRGPLLRAALLRLEDAEHLLLLTLHHIAGDLWSLGVLMRELAALYSGEALPALPVQYADYAVWQRGWLAGEALARQLDYWRGRLAGLSPLALPADRRRGASASQRGGTVDLTFPPDLAAALRQVGRESAATLFMTLLSGFQLLLARYAGQEDVAVGTAAANRALPEVEGLVGFFVNVLVLRTSVAGRPTFRQLLGRVREATLGAYAHQDLPFERLVEELRPARDASMNPLAQVGFQLQNAPFPTLRLPGLELAVWPVESRTAKLDLSATLGEDPATGALGVSLEYSADLFERATVERLGGHFRRLLEEAAADPGALALELPLLSAAERRQLLVDWNRTDVDWGPVATAPAVFAAQAARTPDAIALVDARSPDARLVTLVSYAELDRQSSRLAHHLRSLGVGPEARVGLCLDRGPDLLAAILGVQKAGGAYVPLDPELPRERLAFMIADAAPRAVLATSRHAEWIAATGVAVADMTAGLPHALPGGLPDSPPEPTTTPDNAAYVIYTSGSTGRPKGVVVEHRSLFFSIYEEGTRWVGRRPRRILQVSSPSFDASLSDYWNAFAWGGALIFGAPADLLPGPGFVRLANEQAVDFMGLPPAILMLLDPADFPGLATISVFGEACPDEVVRHWAPGRELWNGYGPTETTVGATTSLCSPRKLPPPIGRPIANGRAYVLDPALLPLPVGVPGELYIGGCGVSRGYLGRPDLTAERFLPDPFGGVAGARLYRTGDRVRWRPDGELAFLGRLDHQVKLRGFRIELGEVEAALRRVPGVREAAAALRDEGGEPRLVAYVVPEEAPPVAAAMELWPSVAEYFVYDEALYYAMTHDEERNARYRRALQAAGVAGATVLDVGTGADLVLARLCLAAGARRVYAVETLAESHARAAALARRLGLGDRCVVLHGDARELALPEPVDLCVSEIVGPIGGCEGAAPILDAVRRLLRDGGTMVPERSVTRIAAVSLPDDFLARPRFVGSSAGYVERIFAEVGRPFDLRVCIKNFSPSCLASSRGVFEDLDFRRPLPRAFRREVELEVDRRARLDGLVLWLELHLGGGEVIDALEREYIWLPVYLPAFSGVEVEAGDRVVAVCAGEPSDNGVNPDYRIEGVVERPGRPPVPFALDLPHHPRSDGSYRASPFYERLWAGFAPGGAAEGRPPRDLARGVREELARTLPGYMVPSAVVVLPALPLGPTGKVDRRALPAPPAPGSDRADRGDRARGAPLGPLAEIAAGIWAEVLGVPAVGAEDDFFTDLGGHSLLATQVISRLRERVGIELPLRSLFEAPTVERWATLAERAAAGDRPGDLQGAADLAGGEIRRRDPTSEAPPLSHAQERLWLTEQLAPGSAAYNMPLALRLTGRLDAAALAGALRGLVARHEVLRTRIGEAGGRPVQVIAPEPEAAAIAALPVVDLHALGAAAGAAADRLAGEEAERPFDLARGPLVRARLLRLSDDDHLLVLNLHHIVADGWSMGVLVGELAALYAGETLPELPVQYADFALWQRERLSGEALAGQLDHWRRRLAGMPALAFPGERRRPGLSRGRGGRLPFALPPDLAAALRRLGRAAGATLFMTLAAGFQALLARYSGEDDIGVGTVVANRRRRELEGLVGFFVNTLVLRTDLAGGPTVRELLARVRETTLDAYAHQDLPFERLVEELRPARDGRPPLVQALVALQNAPLPALVLPDLALSGVELGSRTAKFELSLLLAEQEDGGVAGVVEYDADLLPRPAVERLAGHLQRVLQAMAASPDAHAAELPMLSDDERRQLVVGWSGAARRSEPGPALPFHEIFAARARRAPDAAALAGEGSVLTYGELDRRANRLAHRLRAAGVGPEARVGLCLPRGPEIVAAILAVWKAGGAYVPLDPGYPPERLAWMVEDAAPGAVLALARDRHRIAGAPVLALDLAGDGFIGDEWAAFPDAAPPARVTADHAAYVIYTSGSTGRPKGALVPHRSLFARLHAIAGAWDLARPRRVLQFSSPSFDASVGELAAALPWGGALVHGSHGEDGRLRPAAELAALAADQAVDFAILPPSLLAHLDPRDFPGLRTLVAAGEALPPEVAARWSRGRALWNGYGPTECTVFSTTALLRDDRPPPPIGGPLAGVRAHVMERGGEPAPEGVPGELWIGGTDGDAGLARGYLGRPELTAERFVPDPFALAPGARLYRSGDLARWRPDGELDYLGRLDHQVKLRGFRIELGEIEAALAASPRLREAVVLLRQDARASDGPPGSQGIGDPRLVAYLVPSEAGAPPSAAELRALCERRLPDYMVPAAFVFLERLPLSPNGKVDRRALPAPEAGGDGRANPFAAPRTPLEELLAGIWEEVLGVERIGVDDDFFADLGGHSLLATRVLARTRELLGLDLPLRSLFEAPTVAGWAAALGEVAGEVDTAPEPELVPRPDIETDEGAPPLSFAQERLWFLEQLTPGLAVYNVPLALRLDGALDPARLALALRGLIARHEVLRTRFASAGGRPVQAIEPAEPVAPPLPVTDLEVLGAAREAEALRLAAEEAARPFDLARAPLVRTRLLRLSGDGGSREHLLLLTFHHAVSDGWSLGVALGDLAALYAGEPLPPLPVQYADYAVWQRELLSGERLGRQLAYWRERLAGLPPLELPADRPRPAVRGHRGGGVAVALPASLAAPLRRLGRAAGATLFMTLLSGFAAVLARWSGQDDLAVGTAVANRRRRELEGLVGFFVNTLVLRADLAGGPDFAALLARGREVTLGAFAHQDLPFERLVEELRPARDTGRNPLVQVLLVLQNTPLPRLALPGLSLSAVAVESRTAKFDLTLSLAEGDDGAILGGLEYDADLFEAATAARLAGHLARLLAAAVAAPETPVADLPLLGDDERLQVVVDWNRTARDWGAPRLVHELFEIQAARTPEAIAVISGHERLTYAGLERRSAALARRLRGLSIGPERFAGVCLPRSAEMVVALLAVLRAGGAYVPLDPELPEVRLLDLCRDAGLRAVVAGAATRGLGFFDGAGLPVLDAIHDAVPPDDAPLPPSGALPENAAYAIYTSGSTGRPKGVVNAHAAVANRLLWMQAEYGFTGEDRLLQKTPFSFDVSVWELFAPLASGAALVMARPGGHRDPEYLVEVVASERVTIAHFVPSMLAAFLDARGMERAPTLREVFCSGEALTAEHARRFFAQSAAGLNNLYGPTEAAIEVSRWRRAAGGPAGPVTIGAPIANARLYVLDAARRPAPIGVPGELAIGGLPVARGYLGQPAETAERFAPDPFADLWSTPGARIYRTGDLARWRADGEIEYLGRLDHQVKLRGFRVEPGEIEALLASSPAVGEAVVVLREDAPGDRRLVAYVTPAPGTAAAAPDLADLRRLCALRLPAYMVPSAFVPLDRLPLLPSGKLDRRALPIPRHLDASTRSGLAPAFAPPSTPMEEILAGLWAEVLGVARVGVEDGFFTDLGGHSLLATQVVSRVRERLGIALPLRSLFEAPTVRAWAALAEASDATAADREPIRSRPRTEELPLSYPQERLWFLEQLLPGLPVYNLPLAVKLTGRLDPAALGRVLAGVVARHEVLRTGFRTVEGRPVLAVASPDGAGAKAVPLPLVDLSGVADRADDLSADLALAEASRVFDLERGPLLRARLLRLGSEEHLLLLTIHHIASDGWSLGVLVGEVAALYAGETLPELPIQYADYAAWQREHLAGEALAEELDYWRERLAGLPVLALPTDRPRPAVARHRGGQVRLGLPADLAAPLRRFGLGAGATLFMTLLAGFQVLLARTSGQDDFAVGTAVANRRRREVEGLIGFFVNTLTLRASLAGNPSFGELLARVRETALGAYVHQDLPFERLVAELRPERDTGHEPLVQVSFLLQNAPLPQVALPGLALESVPVESRTAKFDLLVSMSEHDQGIAGVWEHDADLFDPATALRMAAHHRRLLAAALADPERPVAELPLLDDEERSQVLAWSRPSPSPLAPIAAPPLVRLLFATRAGRAPDAVAVVARGRAVTYGELGRRAAGLARRLRALGVGPDVRVGLAMERGPELVAGVLGILAAGGAYVPLDPAYPAERLALMLADSAPRAVLAAPHLAERMAPLAAPVPVLVLDGEGAGDDLAELSLSPALPESAAYVLFTSGSTGRPKGVAMPHRALANLIAWQLADAPRPARTLQLAPASFDVSFQEMLSTLGGGGTLITIDEEVRRDPQALLRLLDEERVERLFLPFTALQHLAQASAVSGVLPSALAEVMTAGERLQATPEVAVLFRNLPGSILWNQYGPTETHVVTAKRLAGDSRWDLYPAIGRPIPGAPVYVLDRSMEPSPSGVPGELYIGGVAVARGYLGRPELTAERFVPDPFAASPGGRLYRTGDRARWRQADGEIEFEIEFLGRVDEQVKLRGFRIEPGEIEALLLAEPGVREAAVAVREDTPGDQRLVAYLALDPESPASLADLRRRCREALPAHMVPSGFVTLDRLPLLPSGKLDRRALPAASGARPEIAARYVEPQSLLEREIAQVWREVLGVDRVGLHDNFFDLGGHSLLAVRLHDRLQPIAAARGRRSSVVDVFRHPTVESFARSLAEETGGAGPPAAPLAEEKGERLVDGRSRLERQQAARRAAIQKRRSR